MEDPFTSKVVELTMKINAMQTEVNNLSKQLTELKETVQKIGRSGTPRKSEKNSGGRCVR